MNHLVNIPAAKTAELLAFYNAHSGKPPVARFADRATAEKRVRALIAAIVPNGLEQLLVQPPKEVAQPRAKTVWEVQVEEAKRMPVAHLGRKCPHCGAVEDLTAGRVVTHRGVQHVVDEHIWDCHACGHKWDYNTGKPVRKPAAQGTSERSTAIAASWQDADVAARRAARHGVRVVDPKGGAGNYKSVREAFLVLALPLGQHIRFRGQLKAAGAAEFGGFKFKLLETA